MTTFRKGDRVELTVEVRTGINDGNGKLMVDAPIYGSPSAPPVGGRIAIDLLHAGRLLPRAIGVGDRVIRGGDAKWPAVVVAISEGTAWIRYPANRGLPEQDALASLSDLTPAPEEK